MKTNQQKPIDKDKRLKELQALVKMYANGKKKEAKLLMQMLYSK